MKIMVLLMTLVLAPLGFALDKEEILEISKKPHDRTGLSKEMKFFPIARGYTAELTIDHPDGETHKIKDIKVEEKVVDGKYLFSKMTHPDAPGDILMVVEFDEKVGVYRKSVMVGDEKVAESIGTVVPDTKSIAWTSTWAEGGMSSLGNEHHTDGLVRWHEVLIEDGKVVNIQRGVAKKTK